jgi:hypothetical protein
MVLDQVVSSTFESIEKTLETMDQQKKFEEANHKEMKLKVKAFAG